MHSIPSRPSLDEYYVGMLEYVKTRATCRRRQVGAIITDHRGKVLATGYNGVPRTIEHCVDVACPGADDPPGDSSRCQAIHAEQNALLQAGDALFGEAHTIYCSCFPCFTCSKLICNTSIQRVVFKENYVDASGLELFDRRGIELIQLG